MNVVCKQCQKVLKDGEWVFEIIPIEHVTHTICPTCQRENDRENQSSPGMVYPKNKWNQSK